MHNDKLDERGLEAAYIAAEENAPADSTYGPAIKAAIRAYLASASVPQGVVEAREALIKKYAAPVKLNPPVPASVVLQHFREFADEVAALASPQIPSGGAGPVAWQWRYKLIDGSWSDWRDGRAREWVKKGQNAREYEDRPLYTSPPSPQADPVDGWREMSSIPAQGEPEALVGLDQRAKPKEASGSLICPKCGSAHITTTSGQGLRAACQDCGRIGGAHEFRAEQPETSPATGPEVGGETEVIGFDPWEGEITDPIERHVADRRYAPESAKAGEDAA